MFIIAQLKPLFKIILRKNRSLQVLFCNAVHFVDADIKILRCLSYRQQKFCIYLDILLTKGAHLPFEYDVRLEFFWENYSAKVLTVTISDLYIGVHSPST